MFSGVPLVDMLYGWIGSSEAELKSLGCELMQGAARVAFAVRVYAVRVYRS